MNRLSERQFDYLKSLDGRNRVAWCASVDVDGRERGIGLARHVRLPEEEGVVEFAVTVIDEFQGRGITCELLQKLIETARDKDLCTLRGHVLVGNRRMLSLCRNLGAEVEMQPPSTVTAELRIQKAREQPCSA